MFFFIENNQNLIDGFQNGFTGLRITSIIFKFFGGNNVCECEGSTRVIYIFKKNFAVCMRKLRTALSMYQNSYCGRRESENQACRNRKSDNSVANQINI